MSGFIENFPPMLQSLLLIDDDKVTNHINERLIRKLNITRDLIIKTNGQDALEYLRQRINHGNQLPDLILVDINMPIMDGFEFLFHFNKIITTDLHITVIMLTTSADKNDLDKAKTYSINAYLNKPLTEEKLKNLIQEHFIKKGKEAI